MRILDLAMKDLSQMLRDRQSLVFIVAIPVLITLFMGFAYRGSASEDNNGDTRFPLGIVNPHPDGILNRALLDRLESSGTVRPISMDEEDAMAALQKGEIAGILIIPDEFSDLTEASEKPQLRLIAQANSTQGQSLYQLLRRQVSQLMSAVEIAAISADLQADPDELSPAFELAWTKWDENSRMALVKTEQAIGSSDWTGGNPYNQASPGTLVQCVIFGLVTSAQILVQERNRRTLQRQMTTAMQPAEIVAGHFLAMFALAFLQTLLLVVFGQLALSVDYLRQPAGVLLLSIGLSLWVASVGLLIGVLAKGEQQVIMFSLVAMFFFSALGGTWFPLEAASGAFAAIGRILPSAWAMTGYQNILIRGLGFSSATLPGAMLLGYTALFFTAAVWRFRKMEI